MILINEIRKNSELMEFEQAVDCSVCYCIENDILKEFLQKHRSEVVDMCITEYNEKVFINGIREEGRQEGRRAEKISTICKLLSKGMDHDFILSMGYTDEQIEEAEKQLLTTV